MEGDFLIDFNSPLRKCGSMVEPLVPLPRFQDNNINQNLNVTEIVGDNPFDNVILQVCKINDPFEMTENETLALSKEYHNPVEQKAEQSIGSKSSQQSVETSQVGQAVVPDKREVSESTGNLNVEESDKKSMTQTSLVLSPTVKIKFVSSSISSPSYKKIDARFSKLILSTQFDEQILDESSKCIDSGVLDSSALNSSTTETLNKSEKSPLPERLPRGPEEVKAFVAHRIEKCIEKALNESRKSLNFGKMHRRSLSASSMFIGTEKYLEKNPLNYSSLKPSHLPASSMYKNRSFSSQDLRTSLTSALGNQHFLDFYGNEKNSRATDPFNIGFRKSSATSSMYSSYAAGDIGFRKNSSSLANYQSLSSSFTEHVAQGNGSDSVFLEAKNLSFILQRRANAGEDEPLEDDVNFLNDGNFKVDLVESDSSYSDDSAKQNSTEKNIKMETVKGSTKSPKFPESNDVELAQKKELPLPLSQSKIARMELSTSGIHSTKFQRPSIPSLPAAMPSSSKNGNIVLKLRTQSDSQVNKRGPLKAVIPLGNMMRQEPKSGSAPPLKLGTGFLRRESGKTDSSSKGLRRSVSGGDLQKSKDVHSKRATSPTTSPVCGLPLAQSTPSLENVAPLTSPPVTLQMSQISNSTPIPGLHRRSKSADVAALKKSKMESQPTKAASRKASGHIRSRSGASKIKCPSPDALSPGQLPICTSTPLKPLIKNTPLRGGRNSVPINKKIMQKESSYQSGKENIRVPVERKHQPLWRPSTRRMEAK